MWAEAVGIEMGVGWSLGVGGGQEAGGDGQRGEKREGMERLGDKHTQISVDSS